MFRSIRLERLFISTSDLLSIPTLYCNALSPLGSPFSVAGGRFSEFVDTVAASRFAKRGWNRRKDRKDERGGRETRRTGFNEKKRRAVHVAEKGRTEWRGGGGERSRERERTRGGCGNGANAECTLT